MVIILSEVMVEYIKKEAQIMSDILGNLNPRAVFHYFEEMTKIPRESGNEAAISQYLVDFANEHGLEVIQEPCKNVIIKKPATAGYENAPRVIYKVIWTWSVSKMMN